MNSRKYCNILSILKLEIMFVANIVIPIISDSYSDPDPCHLFNAFNCDNIESNCGIIND